MYIWNKSLQDQDGNLIKLEDYKGEWLVVYVYPKDDTPGCSTEACGFRDNSDQFATEGVTVLGVSKDNVDSHKDFAQKHKLGFVLLSDPDLVLIKELGAYGQKRFMGREFLGVLRNTYIFNPDGDMVKEYVGVNPLGHAQMVLKDIQLMKTR
jgi:thioredoxin-dependent peroxiredoxin